MIAALISFLLSKSELTLDLNQGTVAAKGFLGLSTFLLSRKLILEKMMHEKLRTSAPVLDASVSSITEVTVTTPSPSDRCEPASHISVVEAVGS
jgi:hypothetical protein